MDALQVCLGLGLAFVVGFGAWVFLDDRAASREAAMRPRPIRRRNASFRLPEADETRLSIARFRRVIGEWALLEQRADNLARRAEALRRRGLL